MKKKNYLIGLGIMIFILLIINNLLIINHELNTKFLTISIKNISSLNIIVKNFFDYIGTFIVNFIIIYLIGIIIFFLLTTKKLFSRILVFTALPLYFFLIYRQIEIFVNYFLIFLGIYILSLIYIINFLEYDKNIIAEEEKHKISGSMKKNEPHRLEDITIMFIDIQNFTNISEKLKSPYLIGKVFLNPFIRFIENTIITYNGTLDKIMGDGVMLLFRGENKEINAIACGLYLFKNKDGFLKFIGKNVQNIVKSSNIYKGNVFKFLYDTLKQNNFDIRIGVASGTILIGSIGGKSINEITVIGDAVNLASRLEGINKNYKTGILCDENTACKLGENFIYRKIDKIKVKGKDNYTYAIQPIYDRKTETYSIRITEDDITMRNEVMQAYFHKKFEKAGELIKKYIIEGPKDPTGEIMWQRIQDINTGKIKIPNNWDGTWKFETK